MRSGMAPPVPLYGTCVSWTPAMLMNISPARCDAEPGPEDAMLISRGLLFASAMKSCTVLTGNEFVTVTAYGCVDVTVIAARSRSGSYGRLGMRVALIACDGLTSAIV